MNAEPLKGKGDIVKSSSTLYDLKKDTKIRTGTKAHYDEDIRSAVEWLKKECQDYQNYGEKSWLFNKINEAFKDVIE